MVSPLQDRLLVAVLSVTTSRTLSRGSSFHCHASAHAIYMGSVKRLRYIGLDAHVQSCTFVVMSAAGRRLREQVVVTNGEALRDFIRSVTGQKHLCLEEGTMSEWMYELFEPLVDEIVVVVPERSKGNKNDSKDAWARAEELRCGSIQRAV